MPVCVKCSAAFPNIVEVEGRPRWLHRRKYCLECSPFAKRAMNLVPRTGSAKRCSSCRQEKELSEFWNSKRYKDGYTYNCKQCARGKWGAIRDSRRKLVFEYLCQHECADCGEKDPFVLQFDHVRGTKKADVSRMVSDCRPLDVLLEEIGKCDIVCGNCHRRRTIKQFGHLSCLLK